MTETDVVIVGAGFAGLTAARALQEARRSVVVLEARERVGGRTHTVPAHGTAVDLGGQWIGPGQDRIAALVEELGFSTWPQTETGDDVVLGPEGARRAPNIADQFSEASLTAYIGLVTAFEEICDQVPTDAPWQAAAARFWDSQTLATWADANCDDQRARDLFELGIQAIFAASSAQLSLLHVAHYTAASGGWSKLTDTGGGAQQDRITGGVQPVAEALAEQLGPVVRCSTPVTAISQDPAGVTITTALGEQVSASRAVVALPPALAGRLRYDPAMPADRDQLTQQMPQGSVIKFHALYERPWWRDEGLSGMVLGLGESTGATFDCTPPEGYPGVITGFFEGPHAVEATAMTRAERRKVVLDVLERGLGPQAAEAMDYLDMDWSSEVWTRGCYAAHLPPGVLTQLGPALRRPVGRIHWASTETARRWVGYIDGAIDAGEAAAAEVLAADGPA